MTASESPRLADRLALITGASRGIGRAVARRFAAEGAHVILLARTKGALEEVDDEIRAAGGQATLVPADLNDHAAIDAIGGAIFQRFGRLDILVANAALLGVLSPLHHVDPKVWNQVMSVNVTANWRLIRAFDPLLRESTAGRAIFVTSGASQQATAYWGPYAVSKAALDMLAMTYAAEVAKTAIRVNLVNPGRTRTGMRAQAFPGEDPLSLKTPESITDAFVDLAAADCTAHGEWIEID